jgi:hypothetical protein
MSHRWKRSAQVLAASAVAVLTGLTMVPTGASAVSPAAPRPALLKPNLIVLPAADLYIQRTSSARYLRFESGLGNIGRGPIEVRPNTNRPCPDGHHHATQVIYRDGSRFFRRAVDTQVARRSAGCMIYHPAHNHWHFQAASRYTLFQPGEERTLVQVARRKMSFCLRDSRRVPQSYGTYHQPEFYGACSKHSPQGISVGWVDVYQSFLAGQALRLPQAAGNGLYCLQIKVDPRNQLLESDDGDNTSMRAFTLRGDRIAFQPASRCT